VQIQRGQQGTLIPQETWQYYAHAYNVQTIAPLATGTMYRNGDGTGTETTSHAYTWGASKNDFQDFSSNVLRALRRDIPEDKSWPTTQFANASIPTASAANNTPTADTTDASTS